MYKFKLMCTPYKVGDKLVCISNTYSYNQRTFKSNTTVGKVYKIEIIYDDDAEDFFVIHDDKNFEMPCYGEKLGCFINLIELRKLKLERLGCTSLIGTEE